MFTTAGSRLTHGVRLTEVPSLYGLIVREAGELIEYISYEDARRRMSGLNALTVPVVSRLQHQRFPVPSPR